MRYLAFVIFLALVSLVGCSSPSSPIVHTEVVLQQEYLTQHWVHSREEAAADSKVEVFRPTDYKEFPPSRFRKQYIFNEGGDCLWYYLAPNDGHHFRPGTWAFDTDEADLLYIQEGDQRVIYRVVELTEELLRMMRVEPVTD